MGHNSVASVISLADVAFQICEIPRHSQTVRTYISSGSSKVIDLGLNGRIAAIFEVSMIKMSKVKVI